MVCWPKNPPMAFNQIYIYKNWNTIVQLREMFKDNDTPKTRCLVSTHRPWEVILNLLLPMASQILTTLQRMPPLRSACKCTRPTHSEPSKRSSATSPAWQVKPWMSATVATKAPSMHLKKSNSRIAHFIFLDGFGFCNLMSLGLKSRMQLMALCVTSRKTDISYQVPALLTWFAKSLSDLCLRSCVQHDMRRPCCLSRGGKCRA